MRKVLLLAIVRRSLLTLRGEASDDDPVASHKHVGRLARRVVNAMVKRAARRPVSMLRHAHGSHAIEPGASLPEVQATLGHGDISTTSG
jgi:integrase/recombinase XerD